MINTEAEPIPSAEFSRRGKHDDRPREDDQDSQQQSEHDQDEPTSSKRGPFSDYAPHPDFFDFLRSKLDVRDIGILLLGVVVPSLMILSFGIACSDRIVRLIIKHPVETLIEATLIIAVPIINLVIWKAIKNEDSRYARRHGLLLGVSIGTSAVVAIVSATALALGYPVTDIVTGTSLAASFTFITVVAWLALSQGLYMAALLRQMREMKSSRVRQVFYSVTGALLALLAFAGSEARSTAIRFAEQMAISHDQTDKKHGLKLLSDLNAKRDLIMEGADDRTAGFPGLFIQINPERIKPLYFAVTGDRYRSENESNYAAMSSDYLLRHFVGEPVKGLSLLRSTMTGAAHPDTSSSTVNWTLVFSNDTNTPQQACAQIALPPGAVITGIAAWPDGKRKEADFLPAYDANNNPNSGFVGNWGQSYSPVMVSDVGRGRMLMHCNGVAPHAEMKIQLTVVTPMIMQTTGTSTMTLPRFVNSNFAVKGDHQLMVRTEKGVQLEIKDGESRTLANGENTLVRTLKDDDLTGGAIVIGTKSRVKLEPVAAQFGDSFIYQQVRQVRTSSPKDLVVVIDGSSSMGKHIEEVKSALKKIPGSINASMILATEESSRLKIVPLKEGLEKLKKDDFVGGQDNLEAVVKAAERAGSDFNGAVLWVHGQQPCYSKEIYLMAPFVAKPKMFEVALDNGETDVQEFLKNHDDIGPVSVVPRVADLRNDLEHFVEHWKAGEVDSVVTFNDASEVPEGCATVTGEKAKELSALWAQQKVAKLIENNQMAPAAALGAKHHIVSAASFSAVANAASQQLQGATMGTIGADATIISGVNTAGTVRVNNLSNLEALLSIFANGLEILGLIIGGTMSVNAFISPKHAGNRIAKLCTGLMVIAGGLSVPGVVNWFVASARDANLFS